MAKNTGEEDVPGVDQPDTPGDVAGFDIGWAPMFQARIDAPIREARKEADRLKGIIVERLVQGVAEPAAFADAVRSNMVAPIVAPMQEAAQFADGLSGRVLTPIIQAISDAAAWGRRWGVWPNMGDGQNIPVDVLEARALTGVPSLPVPLAPDGLPWVLTPDDFRGLQERYRVEVLPLFGVDTAEYTRQRERLEDRIPPGSVWEKPWREFTMEALAVAPMVPPGPSPMNFTRGPNVGPSPGGGTGSTPAPTSGGGFPVPGGVLPPGFTGGAPIVFPGAPQTPIDVPGSDIDSCPWQYAGRPGNLLDDPAWKWVPLPTDSGPCWRRVFGDLPEFPCVEQVVKGIQSGRFNVERLEDCQGGLKPGAGGLPPALPPGPTPSPGEQPEPPCVKICGLDELIDALKPDTKKAECPKYKAWRDASNGECYVQPSAREPRNREDKFLAESDNPQVLVDAVNRECGKKAEKRPEQGAPPALGFGRGPAACDWILPPVNAEIAQWENPFGWLVGVVDQNNQAPPNAQTSGLGLFGEAVARFFRGTIGYGLENVWKVIRGFLANDPCFGGGNAQLTATRTVFNFLQRYFGAALEPAIIPLTQHQNFLCPTEMPGPVDAARSYLANTINEDTARCWIRAAGMRDTLYDRVIRAARSTLNADQVVRLARRGVIPAPQVPERLRELGFLDQRDYSELYELSRALPGPSDVVRFMVRDVDDAKIVGRFGLDDEFKDKFAGLTAEYAKAQGIDPDLMSRYWRAHWSIPSPTQLLEMFHRLRNRPPGDPLRVELEDIETALKQNDVLPYWVPKLLAVSFRPLRQVDVKRAYLDGTIDLEEVRRSYTDYGYSDENADVLTRHQEKQKRLAAGRHPAVIAYADGAINGAELDFELMSDGFSPDDSAYALARARALMERRRRKSCGLAYKRRMIRRELDPSEVNQKLLDLGLDPMQADTLSKAWQCETSAKGKEFTANQLCDLYDRGLITAAEFVRRLESSGWTRDDAIRIYTVCSQNIDAKRRADEIRAMRQREADAERLAKKAEAEKKKLESALAKQGREEDRISRLNDARNRGIIEAGDAWAKKTQGDLSDAISSARAVYKTVRDSTTATQSTILRALITSSKSKGIDTLAGWVSEALTIATSGTFSDPNSPPVE